MTDFWKYQFLKIRLSSPNSRNFRGAFGNTSRVIRPGNPLSSIDLLTALRSIPKANSANPAKPKFPRRFKKTQFMYRKIQGPFALQVCPLGDMHQGNCQSPKLGLTYPNPELRTERNELLDSRLRGNDVAPKLRFDKARGLLGSICTDRSILAGEFGRSRSTVVAVPQGKDGPVLRCPIPRFWQTADFSGPAAKF